MNLLDVGKTLTKEGFESKLYLSKVFFVYVLKLIQAT